MVVIWVYCGLPWKVGRPKIFFLPTLGIQFKFWLRPCPMLLIMYYKEMFLYSLPFRMRWTCGCARLTIWADRRVPLPRGPRPYPRTPANGTSTRNAASSPSARKSKDDFAHWECRILPCMDNTVPEINISPSPGDPAPFSLSTLYFSSSQDLL